MNSFHAGWGRDVKALNRSASRSPLPTRDQPIPISGRIHARNRGRKWDLARVTILLLIGLALGFGFASLVRAGDTAPSEAQVKAAFLLNFPKYVEWPATAFAETNSPIVVAILDADSVADEFSTMSEGRIIDGHPVRLQRITALEQCHGCHILFIGSARTRKLPDLLPKLRGLNVLTVGESDDFLDVGGMINLARRDRRITLEVNMDSVREARLKVSSKLLALATVKGGKK
jgi:hypothetical protein